eukprot:CAMPEP_0119147304 /NCGR_PEP_ID=MMETSP1310-20130426/40155_1 /TAXON_ID=464262 /ORGANISM="Genus nov. species nov., Strain RCC2339" /LENGTH=512 /DNA_ID=CAMNT_0007139261 /DNA_START=96 /DNA_END=1634 /DNA_ORIENTATION=-
MASPSPTMERKESGNGRSNETGGMNMEQGIIPLAPFATSEDIFTLADLYNDGQEPSDFVSTPPRRGKRDTSGRRGVGASERGIATPSPSHLNTTPSSLASPGFVSPGYFNKGTPAVPATNLLNLPGSVHHDDHSPNLLSPMMSPLSATAPHYRVPRASPHFPASAFESPALRGLKNDVVRESHPVWNVSESNKESGAMSGGKGKMSRVQREHMLLDQQQSQIQMFGQFSDYAGKNETREGHSGQTLPMMVHSAANDLIYKFIHNDPTSFRFSSGSSASNEQHNNRGKKVDRSRKEKEGGLRHCSARVRQKVEEKGETTYNEVADILVDELVSSDMEDSAKADVKKENIRRRVYDAINVLRALGIIEKRKQNIRWLGFPPVPEQEILNLEKSNMERCEGLRRKYESLQDIVSQIVAYRNLTIRNAAARTSGTLGDTSSGVVKLPFIMVQTDNASSLSWTISGDRKTYNFTFGDRFALHDDSEILRHLNMMPIESRPPEDILNELALQRSSHVQ